MFYDGSELEIETNFAESDYECRETDTSVEEQADWDDYNDYLLAQQEQQDFAQDDGPYPCDWHDDMCPEFDG